MQTTTHVYWDWLLRMRLHICCSILHKWGFPCIICNKRNQGKVTKSNIYTARVICHNNMVLALIIAFGSWKKDSSFTRERYIVNETIALHLALEMVPPPPQTNFHRHWRVDGEKSCTECQTKKSQKEKTNKNSRKTTSHSVYYSDFVIVKISHKSGRASVCKVYAFHYVCGRRINLTQS